MRRNSVRVRPATVEDIDMLAGFGGQVRAVPTTRRAPAILELRERYERLLDNPARRVVLAVDAGAGDAVMGMAVLAVDVAGELLDIPVIRVSHLVVERAHRRRGAGRALVGAAMSYADELGLDHVSVGAVTTDREANRFFARLGFAPVMVRRVASLAVLRRHLIAAEATESPADLVRRRGLGVRRVLSRTQHGRAHDPV